MNENYAPYHPTQIEAAAQAHWAQPLWNGHDAYRVTEEIGRAHV